MARTLILLSILTTSCTTVLQEPESTPVDDDDDDEDVDDDDDDDEDDEERDNTGAERKVLSQTLSNTIVNENSVGCLLYENDQPVGNQYNSYYRVFELTAEGVSGDFEVERVEIGVEIAASQVGSQPARLRLHRLASNNFVTGNLDLLNGTVLDIPDQTRRVMSIDLSARVAAGSLLVVELEIPDSDYGERLFIIGSNSSGQSQPAFMRAPGAGCEIYDPISFSDMGRADMHVVMNVTGIDLNN